MKNWANSCARPCEIKRMSRELGGRGRVDIRDNEREMT